MKDRCEANRGRCIDVSERLGIGYRIHDFDLAISLAALIRGARVRRGSDNLKNGC